MIDDSNIPEQDNLDRQIRSALEVEIAPQQLERLEGFWTRQRRSDVWKRRATIAIAVAATILIVASLPFWLAKDAAEPNGRKLATDVEPDKNTSPAVAAKAKPSTKLDELPKAPNVRPSTTYERLYLTARVQERAEQQRFLATNALNSVIDQLTETPEVDAAELVANSGIDTKSVESLLLGQRQWEDDERTGAIIQLLTLYGTKRSVPQLLKLGGRSALREPALSAVERIAGFEGLARAAIQSPDTQLRRAIYRRLLRQEAAMDTYLALAQEPTLSDEVIGSADDLPEHIIHALIARLGAETAEDRLAAALVLGHANGPKVTRALIDRITEESQSPAEAWIALMNCREPQADQFLVYASSQPRLLGSFNRARAYWTRMVH